MELTFAARRKTAALPETAWGLSRFCLDHLLLKRAGECGAEVIRERAPAAVDVVAHGRRTAEARGSRLFGFKAHFRGPATDAVELFFFGRCYVGLNQIEGGLTNVCGLAPEGELGRFGFAIDDLLASHEPLRERIAPLGRIMAWLTTGPLVFANGLAGAPGYYCGDALSFVDPFTGSGVLAACATGVLAGAAAARRIPPEDHIGNCRGTLGRAFGVSSVCRTLVANGWAERLVGFVPGAWLYRMTRPQIRA
jgi:flavin-dependent dehydrogenase